MTTDTERAGTDGPAGGAEHGASLDTAIIFTPRMEELAAFYRDALQLGPYHHSPRHLGQQVGRVYFGFDQDDTAGRDGAAPVTLWFTVDDLQATFDRLVRMGARVRSAPASKPWGGVLACVYDPDGNLLGLSQRRPD
jgi:predicted enzyme related to lactoylglutathione lyase